MVDIARMAGVDVSTVSRALADSPRLTDETKRRIVGIVRETGYVVNRSAKTLRAGRANQVLVILSDIAASFYPDVVKGVEEVMSRHGVNVIVGSTMRDPEREYDLGKQLLTGDVDGLLIMTGAVPRSVLAMPDHRRRIVTLSRPVPDGAIPCVSIDNRAATRAALEHLHALGHRDILHIGGPEESEVFQARASAYRDFMRERGLADRSRVSRFSHFDFDSGLTQMGEVLKAAAGLPSAVFCATDDLAIGAMAAARQAGLRVPQDISFVGFDDLRFSRLTFPPLTTIRIPRADIGRVGADLLLKRLDDAAFEAADAILPFELILRESVAAVG